MNNHVFYATIRDLLHNKQFGEFCFSVCLNQIGNIVVTATATFNRSNFWNTILNNTYSDVYEHNRENIEEVNAVIDNLHLKYTEYTVKCGQFTEELASNLTTVTEHYDSFFNTFPVKSFIEFEV